MPARVVRSLVSQDLTRLELAYEEISRKVPVKSAIPGCHRRLRMILAEREELRRMGRENIATTGLVSPSHVKAGFNLEFDGIDIAVPLGELLVEATKDIRCW